MDYLYRVSIHNQIYSSIYYRVCAYQRAKNGGWKFSHIVAGPRGPGGHLGMSYSEAKDYADRCNAKAGIGQMSSAELPDWAQNAE